MERYNLIIQNNTDNYINPDGWKPGRAINHLSEMPVKKAMYMNGSAKTVAPLPVKPITTVGLLVPKATIDNTGIFDPAPVQTAVPVKPADANSPLVLIPNVPGGLKSETGSVLDKVKAIIETSKPTVAKEAPPKVAEKMATFGESKTPTVTAGFTLPNIKIIIGLVIGALVLYFVGKRYGK